MEQHWASVLFMAGDTLCLRKGGLARRRQRTHTTSSVVSLGLIGNSAVESRGEARVRSRAAAKSEMGTCEVWLCFGVQDVQRIRVGGAVMA
jgi:hypothetical protein